MSNYSFNITVNKPPAFEAYLAQNFTAVPYSDSIEQGTVIITTQTALTDAQLASLTTIVNAYVDPAVFFELARTESTIGVSESNMTTGLNDVHSFIFEAVYDQQGNSILSDGTVLDSLKTIIKLTTADVSTCTDLSSGTVTVELYDHCRHLTIYTQTIDITSILTSWQTLANNGQTGLVTAYKSIQIFGLSQYGTSFDCIWIFRIAVSDIRIKARLNGLQKLFYNKL